MMMKIKVKQMLLALMICISAFFTPIMAYAAEEKDTTPPIIYAEILNEILHIEASDTDTGVDAIYIGKKRINYRVDHAIDLELKDFVEIDKEIISIYAIDFAGNQSKIIELKNPFYENIHAKKPLTPSGQATVIDDVTDENGKEFYTFSTPDENVFYLIIDKQRESENVYFLNTVTEIDLLALTEKKTEKSISDESVIPEMTICNCINKCVVGEVNTLCPICKNELKACIGEPLESPVTEESNPEPPKKQNSGSMIFIFFAVAVIGGAGYYFKIYKPKHDLDDAEDLDDLLDDSDDEIEINEDKKMSEDKEASQFKTKDENNTDAIAYDDYPDDEPEQEE